VLELDFLSALSEELSGVSVETLFVVFFDVELDDEPAVLFLERRRELEERRLPEDVRRLFSLLVF
jgi:hypothetical protein